MTIKIPKKLTEQFLNFLDISQAQITEAHLSKCSREEKELLLWVEDLLKQKRGSCTGRFVDSNEEQRIREAVEAKLLQTIAPKTP